TEVAEKYSQTRATERAFELAWTRSRIESGYLGFKADEIELYLKMLPHIIIPGPLRRKWESYVIANIKGQSGLWPFGISGDVPVILLFIDRKEDIEAVYKILKGHEYWRMKGLEVDLVIITGEEDGYLQPLQEMVKEAVAAGHARDLLGKRGGVFVINKSWLSEEDMALFHAAARIILKSDLSAFDEQIEINYKTTYGERLKNNLINTNGTNYKNDEGIQLYQAEETRKLKFFNETGGFANDGSEYVIYLKNRESTPTPWANIISNENFGFIITESGGGYTWAGNSRENKLTPWSNDPVKDTMGEVIYIRDDETGEFWSITPSPVRNKGEYLITHGAGYTSFKYAHQGIDQELVQFAAVNDPVKISVIKLKGKTGQTSQASQTRKLSLFFFVRPILGVSEKITSQYITTEMDSKSGVFTIKNNYNVDFPGRITFIDSSEQKQSFTGDRMEFIGVEGSLEKPEAVSKENLSGTIGAGLDPCAAIQVEVSLNQGEEKELVFLLGQGKSMEQVLDIIEKYRNVNRAKRELKEVKKAWKERLEVIQVQTPDDSMNIMLNYWLLYQVISCRLLSRAAFYQSGGAFGFRDQLQDVMSLTYALPEFTRWQILLHSSRQFVEGDVQHWWHVEVGKGIRTRYSDDLLWLPYVTADYIMCTGDWSVLDVEMPYIEDDLLPEDQDERYSIPRVSDKRATLYEHCINSISRALNLGEHGIPLMGSGDWNDGMNKVGSGGRGESVWLGWFLCSILEKFIPICKKAGDEDRAGQYKEISANIIQAIENNAWDGSWYLRAWFDDGKPLGSTENTECRIDSIAQSWAAISGLGDIERTKEALKAVQNYLINKEEGIIKLFTPPFDKGDLEPGYIKGYVPGVRENGGQYTHAAVWVILAFAMIGDGDKAHQLFHMINPINHSRTQIETARYKTEPYVMAADVYAIPPNTGRGGWTWYTGAAGWMYRVGVEHILGIKKRGDAILIDPCIPSGWKEYLVKYKYENSLYNIEFKNSNGVNKGVQRIYLDGIEIKGNLIQLKKDGKEHKVEVIMG
ncbi:MAG TPA: glycosyl transferase, partial [Clostridiales bacterium]|nr:glycosyl transferase [Clostridiales bacterium]